MAVISTSCSCSADQKPVQFSRHTEALDRWMCPHRLLYKVLNLGSDRGCVGDLFIDFPVSGPCTGCCSAVNPFTVFDFVQKDLALLRMEKLELDVVH